MAKTNNKTDTLKKIELDNLIKKEIKSIKLLIKDVDKEKVKGLNSLIENTAFMAVKLRELMETMHQDGMTCEYKNGENQFGVKKSPESELYISMFKNYGIGMSKILEQSPKGSKLIDDGFDDFLNGKIKNKG